MADANALLRLAWCLGKAPNKGLMCARLRPGATLPMRERVCVCVCMCIRVTVRVCVSAPPVCVLVCMCASKSGALN